MGNYFGEDPARQPCRTPTLVALVRGPLIEETSAHRGNLSKDRTLAILFLAENLQSGEIALDSQILLGRTLADFLIGALSPEVVHAAVLSRL